MFTFWGFLKDYEMLKMGNHYTKDIIMLIRRSNIFVF